jgi:hypothetical protein
MAKEQVFEATDDDCRYSCGGNGAVLTVVQDGEVFSFRIEDASGLTVDINLLTGQVLAMANELRRRCGVQYAAPQPLPGSEPRIERPTSWAPAGWHDCDKV